MSSAPTSGPLREARSCYDHLAGRLGTAAARMAIDRGWVVEEGQEWRLAEDAEAQASQALGVEVRLAALSRRPDLRRCVDWTERVPHLAGNVGAALLHAFLLAGWIERTPGTRALTITELGTERLRRTGIAGITVDASGCEEDDLCYSGGVIVTAAAGEDWGELAERATAQGWTGVVALAELGGTVGDAVTDNYAASGQQVGDVIWSVRTWDRLDQAHRTFAMADCGFRPGGSRFAVADGARRYDVLEVAFLFRAGTVTPLLRST